MNITIAAIAETKIIAISSHPSKSIAFLLSLERRRHLSVEISERPRAAEFCPGDAVVIQFMDNLLVGGDQIGGDARRWGARGLLKPADGVGEAPFPAATFRPIHRLGRQLDHGLLYLFLRDLGERGALATARYFHSSVGDVVLEWTKIDAPIAVITGRIDYLKRKSISVMAAMSNLVAYENTTTGCCNEVNHWCRPRQ